MRSTQKIMHDQSFVGGMITSLSPKDMKNTQYFYSLNCDILSSDDGNVGVVSNIKGTVNIPVPLPEGRNKTIGVTLDEERNKMYFAVWNYFNRHTWYEFDIVTLSVRPILQSITDTGDVNIFNWTENSVILHIDIINNSMLSWTVEGDEARKFNIEKALDKEETGYGPIILEEYTRAYKRTSPFPPEAEYFTNEEMLNNSLYGYLFKFCTQYIYDDGEESVFSDYSLVPIPTEENSTGAAGVPNKNNGIRVRFFTGGKLVRKIRLAMKKTNNEGGESDWVSILVIDKDTLGIPDDSEYEYEFYNNNSYIALEQNSVQAHQSYLPRKPLVQAYAGNSMIYGNFPVGRPTVKDIDFDVTIDYEDLFIDSEMEEQMNEPSMILNVTNASEPGAVDVELIIGPDVKKGNNFFLSGAIDNKTEFVFSVRANANDTARTIASQFYSKLATRRNVNYASGYLQDVIVDGTGAAKLKFRYVDIAPLLKVKRATFNSAVTPVSYSTLKNTGNSVLNDKLGAAFRYALYYEDPDGRKTLAYGNSQLVEIKTVNELGGVKKVVTQVRINHAPPEWAARYGIVRTKNLNQLRQIQVLIQSINTTTVTNIGEEYQDLTLGSLYTYQQVHPNSTLKYEFMKGDRLRYIGRIEEGVETVPQSVVDYEVLAFYPTITDDIGENITIDGTSEVLTAIDSNRIGNHIIIDGNEREIVGINDTGTKYILNSAIGTIGEPKVYPSYQFINKRGIIRIKMSDDYPIEIDPANDIYAKVEVYRPYQAQTSSENENYFDIGYKFDIKNGQHLGNIRDQSSSGPAVIQINGLDNYVRTREMITNTSVKNPAIVLATVEDQSFSDFYVSDLSSYGRPTVLDDARGEVHMGSRLAASDNYIEGTSLNGLSMFRDLERRDYNDKYGDIELLKFYEGRLYVFKHLKTTWGPIYGRVMTDDAGQPFLSSSSSLLPEKLEYFTWEGGVGNNPESVVRDGNDIFGISPNSGVIFRIGGNGVLPISKIFGIDNEARDIISNGVKNGARMFGGYNRKKGSYIANIEPYNDLDNGKTLVFNEDNNQFVGYRSYIPDMTTKFIDEFISFKEGQLFLHDRAEERNNFYGQQYPSVISFYVNTAFEHEKDFFSMTLDGNQPWLVEVEIPTKLGTTVKRSRIKPGRFVFENGVFKADFMRDMNDPRFDTELQALAKGAYLVGKYMKVTLTNNSTQPLVLNSASVEMGIK